MYQFLNVSSIRKGLLDSIASESNIDALGFCGRFSLCFEIFAVDYSHR